MPKIASITTDLNTTAEEDTQKFIFHHVSDFETCINDLTSVEGECSGVYSDINGNEALSDHAFVVEGRGYLYEEKLELLERFNNLFGKGYNIINDTINDLSKLVPQHNGEEWAKYFELINKERDTLLTELNGYKDAANNARKYQEKVTKDGEETTEDRESPEVTFNEEGTPPADIIADSKNPNSDYHSNIDSINEKLPDLGKWNQKILDAQQLQAEAAGKVSGFACPWSSYADAARDGAGNILNERQFAEQQAQNDNYSQYDSYQDYLNDMYTKWGPGGTERMKFEYGEINPESGETTGKQSESSTDQAETNSEKGTESRQTAEESYSMNVQTTSANTTYDDARSLQTEINVEMMLLEEARLNINGLKASLEANKDNLSKETYEKQMALYDERLGKIDEQLAIRSKINNQICDEVRDNFGTDDGPLKDARDWGNNDIATAQSSAQRINDSAKGIESIDSILKDENGEYQVKIYATYGPEQNSNYGDFGENLGNIPYPRDSYSQSTSALAYESAKSQGKTQELPGGAVAFNASEYVNAGYEDSPGSYMSGTCASGDCNTYQSHYSNTNDDYDTVYYDGHYYSYDEYTNLLAGGGE